MSAPRRRKPVARIRVLGVALLVLGVMVGLGAMTELLRHPLPSGQPIEPREDIAPGGDPRDELLCEEPPAREGQGRQPVPVEEYRQVTSNRLYDCPQTYDGTTVRYRGEAVGAVLQRGEHAWVQLNDDIYGDVLGPLPTHRDYRGGNAGIGVLLPRSLAEQITTVGGPKTQGDILEVTAVFHRVHRDSGEVAILRAVRGEVVARGSAYSNPLLLDRLVVASLLAPLALGTVVLARLRLRRR